MTMRDVQRGLLIAGSILFLLGLLQGAAVSSFANPRMALSAHLTAVQSGLSILVAGVVWSLLRLPRWLDRTARWAIAGGMYGLWIALTIAAATGASEALPIAGAGYQAREWVETAVTAAIVSSSLAMTAGWAALVYGLIRG